MNILTYSPKEYDIFIGVDVDKKSYSFTVKDHGFIHRTKKIPANPEYLYNYIRNQFSKQRVICAYEAGPTGFELHDYLNQKDIPCLVISPLAVKKAFNEKVKNNRIDSMRIAQQLKNGEFNSIRVPQGEWREFRHLVKNRDRYITQRRKTKQRIASLILLESLHHQLRDSKLRWSRKEIEELKELNCNNAVKCRLNMLIEDLLYIRRQLLLSHREIRKFIKERPRIYKNIRYIMSIPGIGFITATTVLGKIGDPVNLKGQREIGAFVGVVPKEYSTGDTVRYGRITHLGDRRLRQLLVEAAWVAIRYDAQLRQFYHRIRIKNNAKKGGSQKAIVAVARKLTQRIYRVLKDQRQYYSH